MRRSWFVATMVCCTILVASTSAPEAARRFFGTRPDGAFGGAQLFVSTVYLPANNPGDPGFTASMMVPQGYRKNSPIRITLYLSATGPPLPTPCDFLLVPDFAHGWRPGVEAATIPDDGGRFEAANGSNIVAMTAHPGPYVGKTYVLAGGQGVSLRSGDMVRFGLVRMDDDPADTCSLLGAGLIIDGIKVSYSTR